MVTPRDCARPPPPDDRPTREDENVVAALGAQRTRRTMEDALEPSTSFNPVPTAADRLWFNVCRTIVGIVVLGLTLLNAILCATPLVAEGLWSAPPSPPSAPPAPFTLFSDEDAQATKMILIISGCQALLLGSIAAICTWCRRGKAAEALAAQRARRAERDTKDARRKRKAKQRRVTMEETHDSTSAEQEGPQVALMSSLASAAAQAHAQAAAGGATDQAATPPERTPKGTADDPVVGRLIST